MTYTGRIQNGRAILDDAPDLADGTEVRVETISAEQTAAQTGHNGLLALAGTLKGLPSDFAENHDHYVHGTPKR